MPALSSNTAALQYLYLNSIVLGDCRYYITLAILINKVAKKITKSAANKISR